MFRETRVHQRKPSFADLLRQSGAGLRRSGPGL